MTTPQKQFRFTRTPAKPRPGKLAAESWTVILEPMPDAVPPIVRIRKLLKAASRFYRLRARLQTPLPLAQLPAIATPDAKAINQSPEPGNEANNVLRI